MAKDRGCCKSRSVGQALENAVAKWYKLSQEPAADKFDRSSLKIVVQRWLLMNFQTKERLVDDSCQ